MSTDIVDSSTEELSAVLEEHYDENTITEAFITGEKDTIVSAADMLRETVQKSMKGFTEVHKEDTTDISKTVAGSTQNKAELGASDLESTEVVEPPYPPELMSMFMEVDEINHRCIKVKTTDYVKRGFDFNPVEPVTPEDKEGLSQTTVDEELKIVRNFIRNANENIGFDGVIEKAAMDYEGIGWAAIEIIRSRDMKVRRIAHVPATRIKVLKGWQGFVELIDNRGKKRYYQNFGEKVVSRNRKSFVDNKPLPYDPEEDGELLPSKLQWNLIDRDTGKPTRSFKKSANEIVWCPKHHSSTIYYGHTDSVSAVGKLLARVHIRDYLLQFFEHNTIPRYAIIIEGATLSKDVKETILKYFSTHIKGKAHKTLIIPINSMKGEVKLRFEKLASDRQEGSFLETDKDSGQGIMTAHGVSPAIIGIAEHSELGSGKGLSQAEIYKDRIVTPGQATWALYINNIFRLGLGVQSIALGFDPLDIRDREAEERILTNYQSKGVITVNEVRRRAGLGDALPGGDRAFIVVGKKIVFIDELPNMTSDELDDSEKKQLQGIVGSKEKVEEKQEIKEEIQEEN